MVPFCADDEVSLLLLTANKQLMLVSVSLFYDTTNCLSLSLDFSFNKLYWHDCVFTMLTTEQEHIDKRLIINNDKYKEGVCVLWR